MTARDDHGRTVTLTDVCQCQYDVALAAAEYTVLIHIFAAQRTAVTTAVHRMMATRLADRGNALVDKQTFDVGVLFATIAAQIIDVSGMVDQLLKWRAHFDTVV